MTKPAQPGVRPSIRRHLWYGLGLVILLLAGVGGWAATAKISGAVIASGSLVVDSNVKKIQHPTGGIVGEIVARNGDEVKAGDVVLRLDATLTRANRAIATKSLTELNARKARLEAERDTADSISFPADLVGRENNPEVAHVIAGERRLFALRREARTGQKAQLRERIAQLREEIIGLNSQAKAKSREIALINRELEGARELREKGLMPISKLTELERAAARIEGEKAQLTAMVARTRGRISETELQIIQIDRNLSSEVAKELREIDGRVGELIERKIAAEDQLSRIDIRAPQDGMVHESTAHTVGGVIGAGEVVMVIVPRTDRLTVEAKVAPRDIVQLRKGQAVRLRFSSFSQQATPEINGTLTRISADVTTEEHSNSSYYTIRVSMPSEEIDRLGDVALVPGMPVETFIRTGDRKVISYLVKPLSDQVTRAFREK